MNDVARNLTLPADAGEPLDIDAIKRLMDGYRVITSDAVPPGSLFVMNPIDLRFPRIEPVFDEAAEWEATKIRLRYDVPLEPPLPQFWWFDSEIVDRPQPREAFHAGVLLVVLAVLALFLLGICL